MADDPRPNIILITTDQQRYDTLGVTGADWMRTPNLDALAKRGVLFQHAIAQSATCIPSRACIQTGRYNHQHGVQYMETIIDKTPGLPDHEKTFMERLQWSGYHTAAFGKIHMMPEKGFHELRITGGKGSRWTQAEGQEIGPAPLGREYAAWLEARHPGGYEKIYEQRRHPDYRRYRTAISNVLPLEEYVDYWTTENTLDYIRRDHERPFFVWCGFCGPHGPFDPPKPYDAIYPVEDVPLPPNYAVDEYGNPRETSPEEDHTARRVCAHYWGLVTLIDDMVGRIRSALDEKGFLDNTLITFASDHGEMLFDFGRRSKGNFFEPVIHVPLIVVPPGGIERGRAVAGLVELFDIAPTVLDYASAEIPSSMSATSLRPLMEGHGTARETALCEFENNDRSEKGVCICTERFKYAYWTGGRPELFYDHQEDPLERRNLARDPKYAEEIAHHRMLIVDRMVRTGARP